MRVCFAMREMVANADCEYEAVSLVAEFLQWTKLSRAGAEARVRRMLNGGLALPADVVHPLIDLCELFGADDQVTPLFLQAAEEGRRAREAKGPKHYIVLLSAESDETGWVYFMQAGNGPVKIGLSSTEEGVERRRVTMQTAHPEGLTLIAMLWAGLFGVDGLPATTRQLEAALHENFRDDHIRGEWFHFSDEMRGFLESLRGISE